MTPRERTFPCKTELYWDGRKFGRRDYIALITGVHPKFVFDRRFLKGEKPASKFELRQGWGEILAMGGVEAKIAVQCGLPFVSGAIIEVNHQKATEREYWQVVADSGHDVTLRQLSVAEVKARIVSLVELFTKKLPSGVELSFGPDQPAPVPEEPYHVKKARATAKAPKNGKTEVYDMALTGWTSWDGLHSAEDPEWRSKMAVRRWSKYPWDPSQVGNVAASVVEVPGTVPSWFWQATTSQDGLGKAAGTSEAADGTDSTRLAAMISAEAWLREHGVPVDLVVTTVPTPPSPSVPPVKPATTSLEDLRRRYATA